MVYKGIKESKQYKNVALPGLMNSKSNTNKIDEDSIESLDLNSYKADEDKKTQESTPSIPTGPAMPMPSPTPMPSPSESINTSAIVESSSGNGDDQQSSVSTSTNDPTTQSQGTSSIDEGRVTLHDDDNTDSDSDSIGLPTFAIPESDKGTGVDSMMSALNDFSTQFTSNEPKDNTPDEKLTVTNNTPSIIMPTLTSPLLDNDIANESTISSNPFRPIL